MNPYIYLENKHHQENSSKGFLPMLRHRAFTDLTSRSYPTDGMVDQSLELFVHHLAGKAYRKPVA